MQIKVLLARWDSKHKAELLMLRFLLIDVNSKTISYLFLETFLWMDGETIFSIQFMKNRADLKFWSK